MHFFCHGIYFSRSDLFLRTRAHAEEKSLQPFSETQRPTADTAVVIVRQESNVITIDCPPLSELLLRNRGSLDYLSLSNHSRFLKLAQRLAVEFYPESLTTRKRDTTAVEFYFMI